MDPRPEFFKKVVSRLEMRIAHMIEQQRTDAFSSRLNLQ